jgi:uncharacterized protein
MMRRLFPVTWFCLGLILALHFPVAALADPSFDCKKATSPDELAVCHSAELSELDVIIAKAFAATKASLGGEMANKLHRPFLRLRHECGSSEACILQGALAEIGQFQTLETVSDLPGWIKISGHLTYESMKHYYKVGECAVSTVKEASARLCDEDASGYCAPAPDSGSALFLENDMYGVSYDQEKAVDTAKPGDVVTACLVSLPENCPAGDDRGYIWSYSFKRTSRTVTLPDAEHSCGGA